MSIIFGTIFGTFVLGTVHQSIGCLGTVWGES
jgi:hypothetical protein